MKTYNCPNCTAPITGDSCPYCGTAFKVDTPKLASPYHSAGGNGGSGCGGGGSVFIRLLHPPILDRLEEMEARVEDAHKKLSELY